MRENKTDRVTAGTTSWNLPSMTQSNESLEQVTSRFSLTHCAYSFLDGLNPCCLKEEHARCYSFKGVKICV